MSDEIKPDVEFSKLARDLLFEAKKAEAGKSVDDMTGVPCGMAYGSYHETFLNFDLAYRARFIAACLETAVKAQERAAEGKRPEVDATTSRGLRCVLADPFTGKPIEVRRIVDDTPLDRARYCGTISDIQWLAGALFVSDTAGEVEYTGNAEIIARNGHFRLQSPDGLRAMVRNPNPLDNNDSGWLDGDGPKWLDGEAWANVSERGAWRFLRVKHDLTGAEYGMARTWLINLVEPRSHKAFANLLNTLVNLYSTHDENFAFAAWRHNSDTIACN